MRKLTSNSSLIHFQAENGEWYHYGEWQCVLGLTYRVTTAHLQCRKFVLSRGAQRPWWKNVERAWSLRSFIYVYFMYIWAGLSFLSFHAQSCIQPSCQLFPHQRTYFVCNVKALGLECLRALTCQHMSLRQSTCVTRRMYPYGGFA